MGIKSLVIAASLAGLAMPAAATDMFVEAGIHVGGDELATTGDSDLRAGQLFSLAVGVHTELTDSLQGRASLGYKFDVIDADNGDASIDRFPIEILVMKQSGNFMFGGGLAYHLSPEYEFNAGPSPFTVEFDDALGFMLAFDYNSKGKFEGDWYVGGRITLIDYESSDLVETVSGNSVGAVIGFMFE